MKTDKLVDLFRARIRRRFKRGLKRKPMALVKKLRKAKKEASGGEKPETVRTHLRNIGKATQHARVKGSASPLPLPR